MTAHAHAYWTGHIRLSLVTFPVRLYAAVSDTSKMKLHKISRNSGERVHYKNSTEKEGVIEREDISKGYEYEKGHYVQIEDAELKKLKAESTHTIDIVQFTNMNDIDPIYFDKPYFVAPDGKLANEAYVTLRDALLHSNKVALGQITIGGKERIAAIKACKKGLMIETLRFSDEIREASDYFGEADEGVKIQADQRELAEQLIKMKTRKFDPKAFKDSYQTGLMEIIKAKLGGRPPHLPTEKRKPGNVVNIMDALKRSIGSQGGKGASGKKAGRKPAAKKIRKGKAA